MPHQQLKKRAGELGLATDKTKQQLVKNINNAYKRRGVFTLRNVKRNVGKKPVKKRPSQKVVKKPVKKRPSQKVVKKPTQKGVRYIMIDRVYPMGMDYRGKYFIQANGNAAAIKKFLEINKGEIKLVKGKSWSAADVHALKKFKDHLTEPNTETLIISGKIDVPDKHASETLEEWWETHFYDGRDPDWKRLRGKIERL